jgi:hypothetical protein
LLLAGEGHTQPHTFGGLQSHSPPAGDALLTRWVLGLWCRHANLKSPNWTRQGQMRAAETLKCSKLSSTHFKVWDCDLRPFGHRTERKGSDPGTETFDWPKNISGVVLRNIADLCSKIFKLMGTEMSTRVSSSRAVCRQDLFPRKQTCRSHVSAALCFSAMLNICVAAEHLQPQLRQVGRLTGRGP